MSVNRNNINERTWIWKCRRKRKISYAYNGLTWICSLASSAFFFCHIYTWDILFVSVLAMIFQTSLNMFNVFDSQIRNHVLKKTKLEGCVKFCSIYDMLYRCIIFTLFYYFIEDPCDTRLLGAFLITPLSLLFVLLLFKITVLNGPDIEHWPGSSTLCNCGWLCMG